MGGVIVAVLGLSLFGWSVGRPYFAMRQQKEALLKSIAANKDTAEAYQTILETEKTKEKDPENVGPYVTIGNNWVLIADVLSNALAREEAIAEYERGIARFARKSSILIINAGNAYRTAGRLEEAEAKYVMAMEGDPGYSGGYERLVELYRFEMQKGPADIIPIYQQALEKVFDNTTIVQSLAEYLSSVGRYRDAIPYYLLLAKKYPEQFLPIVDILEKRIAEASSTPNE